MPALLALTLTTGVIDAASYLGLGHVFAANMTGNVVLLGFGLAGQGQLPVLSPMIALVAFLSGARVGGAFAARCDDPSAALRRALAIEATCVVFAIAVCLGVEVRPNDASGDGVVALLAFAMGARNATVRRLGVPELTTTVLTMTLTGLAADPVRPDGSSAVALRRVGAVIAMLTGALVGASLLELELVAPLIGAGLVTVFAASFLRAQPSRSTDLQADGRV